MSIYPHINETSFGYTYQSESSRKPTSSLIFSSKDQISKLEEKLSNYELQYTKQNSLLNEQIKELLMNDSNMKKELEMKSNALYQAEYRLREITNEYNNTKAFNYQSEKQHQELNQKYTEMTLQYKNTTLSLQASEEENKDLKKTNENLSKELNNAKEELSQLKSQYTSMENNYSASKNHNELLTKEGMTIKELVIDCQKENQKMTKELSKHKIIIEEKDRNVTDLQRKNRELAEEIDELKANNDQVSKYQTEYCKTIERLEAEISKTNDINSKAMVSSQIVEEKDFQISKVQKDIRNLITITNDNLDTICRWIQNYLDGNYMNDNDNLPEVQLIGYNKTNIQTDCQPINFNSLCEALRTAKKNYDRELNELLRSNQQLSKRYNEVNKENINKEKLLQNVIEILQRELGDYAQYTHQCYTNDISRIEYLLQDALKSAKALNGVNNNQQKDNDNALVYIDQLKKENEQLSNDVAQLHSEIHYLKAHPTPVPNQSTDITYSFNKLTEEKASLEKKYKYLLNEIELKKAQIKSQEQMLSRRMNDESITKQLEFDKDNLIKDNLILIAQNNQLKEHIQSLKSH